MILLIIYSIKVIINGPIWIIIVDILIQSYSYVYGYYYIIPQYIINITN